MFKTRITELLGIQYPIVCGGMQYVSDAELVAAVSEAGGLGILAVGNFEEKDALRNEIRKIRKLTKKPFGVNATFLPMMRFIDREGLMDVALEEGATVFETSGRITEDHARRIKNGGAKHIHKVARVRDAISGERLGADAIAIVGFECGGAPPMDDITTLIQVPLAVNAVKVPVLAGGGIGDARGFVAALALGAEGVVMGTRFMLTKESRVHPKAKEVMIKATQSDTIPVMRTLGTMERVYKNAVAEKVVEMERRGATLEELSEFIMGKDVREAFETGNTDKGVLPCGEVIGLINDVPSVKEVIDGIISGARDIVERLNRIAKA